MLNYLIHLFTPRLDAVLASFEKTIAKLEKVALHQTELAATKALAAEKALAEKATAEVNALRAVDVQANIKKLLGQ